MNQQKGFWTKLGQLIDDHSTEKAQQLTSAQRGHQSRKRLPRLLGWLTPNGGTLLLVIMLIATAPVWARPLTGPVNVPGPSATTVNYQGRLADNAGTPLDGIYGMSFALYDAATEGMRIWGPEPHTAVPVSEGLFSVGLGSQTSGGIPTNVWNGDRYLEITVGGETLSPRELIRSVPIAGMALTVPDGAIGTTQIANGAIGTSQIAEQAVTFERLAPTAVGKWIMPDNPTMIANRSGASFDWQVLDLSAAVPSMVEIVYLKLFLLETGGNGWCSVRPYGSTSAAGIEMRTPVANKYGSGTAMIALNNARIEWKCQAPSGATISDAGIELWGYFESGH